MRGLTTIRVKGAGSIATANTAPGIANWVPFTPTLTAATPPTLGGAAVLFAGETIGTEAAYIDLGAVILARYQFAFGIGATPGDGLYQIGFPPAKNCVYEFDPQTYTGNQHTWWPTIGQGTIYDSVNDKCIYVQCFAEAQTNTQFAMFSVIPGEGGDTLLIEGNTGVPPYPCNFGVGSWIRVEVWYPTDGYGGIVPV